ncbi:polynucleotide adenylyltransferase [Cystoisospora suis]|uniref:Polynucleotide adenylyltransferase n=1 Tax=Cystoisospora suis TaxID=483139 RepID=A0A2C6LA70_9APIC|nr:polynucleotide adenylyltransferase [Cystoisospora suis]
MAQSTHMKSHGSKEIFEKGRRARGEQPSARMSQDHRAHKLRTPSLSRHQRRRWKTSTGFPSAPSCSPLKPSVACCASLVLSCSGYSPPGRPDCCSSSLRLPLLPSFASRPSARTTSGVSFTLSGVSPSFYRPVSFRFFVVSLAAPSRHAAGSALCQELTTPQSVRRLGQPLPTVSSSLPSPRNRADPSSPFSVSPCLSSVKCCTALVRSLPFRSFLYSYFSGHAFSFRRRNPSHPCSTASTSSPPHAQWEVSPASLLCSFAFSPLSSFFRPFSLYKCKEDSELSSCILARRRPERFPSFSLPGFLFPSSGQLKLNFNARQCLSSACICCSFSEIFSVGRIAPGTSAPIQANHLSFSFKSFFPSSSRGKHRDGYFSRGGNPVPSGSSFPAASAGLSCTSAFTVRSLLLLSAQWSFWKQLSAVSCIRSHRDHVPKANTCTMYFYSPSRSRHTSVVSRNTFRSGIGCVLPEDKTAFLRELPSAHSVDRAGQVIPPAVVPNRGTRTIITKPHWYSGGNWRSSMLSSPMEVFDQDSDDGSEEEEVNQGPDQHPGFELSCRGVGKQQGGLKTQEITRCGGDSGLPRKGTKKQQKIREERSSAARRVLQKEARMVGHSGLRNAAMEVTKIEAEEDEEEGSSPLLDAFASLREKKDSESAARRARGLDNGRHFSAPLSERKGPVNRHLFSPDARDHILDEQNNTTSHIPAGSSHPPSEAATLPHPPRAAPSATPSSPPVSSSWEFCETLGSSSVLSALSAEMSHLEKAMLPGVEQTNAMKTFLSQLQDLLSGGVLEACVVTPFGSAVNGLWTPQSDLDVCVQVKGAYTRAQQIKVLRQIAHALHPVQSHIVEPRFQARVPIIHWTPRFQVSGHVSGGTLLDSQRLEDGRSAALGIPQQRNHIVKDGRKQGMEGGGEAPSRRTGQPSMVACDISVNNLLAVVNSKLLGAYVHTDKRLRTLGYSVKWWAKGRNINDRARGTVSSFSLILMLIHFLQRHANPPVLPSLQDIAIHQQAPPVYIGGVDCRYTSDRTAIERELAFLRNGRAANTRSPGTLLLQFFHYYGYEYKGGVISIRDTSGFIRESHPSDTGFFLPGEKTAAARRGGGLGWTLEEQARVCVSSSERHSENDVFGPLANSLPLADIHNFGGDYLVVDNPFEVGKDVCNVLPCQYQRIRHEFRRAFRMLSDGSTLRQVAAPDARSALRW